MSADSARVAYPLFHVGDGGSRPTSALQLFFRTIDLERAKTLNRLWHSRFPEVGGGNARICHAAEWEGIFYAVAIWTNPSSRNLPQLSWLMLKRWAIAPDAPRNLGSRMDSWMMRDLRQRFSGVETLVTYSDPDRHNGSLYRVCGWQEGATTKRSPSSKKWHNRDRRRATTNDPCGRVTRWTKPLHKGN